MLFPAVLVTQWLNRKTSMKIRKKLKLLLSIKKAKDIRQCLGLKTLYWEEILQGRSQEETTTEANTRSIVRNQPYEI